MNHPTFRRLTACLLAALAMLSSTAAGLTHLRCEYRDNPLGIVVLKT